MSLFVSTVAIASGPVIAIVFGLVIASVFFLVLVIVGGAAAMIGDDDLDECHAAAGVCALVMVNVCGLMGPLKMIL